MIRITLVSLVLYTLFVCSTAQTFQYSHGWIPGKRTTGWVSSHRNNMESSLNDLYDILEGERKLEICLLQLQRLMRNPDSGSTLEFSRNLNRNIVNNNNNNNKPYNNQQHNLNDLEELNTVERIDYGKQ